MFETNVNYLAILVAAVANMGIGFLWYSPILFGKSWMKLMGLSSKDMAKAKKNMGTIYGLSFVATILMGWVISVLVQTTQVLTLTEGMHLAALLWLGCVTTVQFTDGVFSGKPWKLYLINTGYQLTAMLVMGAILVLWV